MSLTTVESRIVGTAGLVLLVAAGMIIFQWVGSPPSGSYQVTAILGDAGSGMFVGADVKVRDVIVGSMTDIQLDENAQAVGTLTLDPEPRLPADVDVVVTDKTVLGEKQIELKPRGPLSEGERLPDGAVLTASPELQPVAFQDVLANFEGVLAAIDGRALARIVDALAFTPEQAELAGRNFDLLGELGEFAARTAPAQLDRLRSFANVIGELATAADDINRLNRTLPTWATLLPDRQGDIRAGLESLERFSDRFATFLRIEEDQIDRFLASGEAVGQVLDPRMQTISEYIFGVYRYSMSLGIHGGNLNDGTEHAWFRVFSSPSEEAARICEQFPPDLQELAPGCSPEGESP